ncbi:MAG: 3-oxoacid CoA-transferase subunit B [Lachnospiraceae bacterium]|nr:3-oxoacid CoA-transferase subunit B [Lachnospiraceae bacterium]
MDAKEFIVRRTAKFFKDGDVVNLGIGMQTMVANYIPEGVDVWLDTENGAIGLNGEPDAEHTDLDLVDATGVPTTLRTGACCFDSFTSFGLIRGGHVAFTILGAFEVDQEGNLANWTVPGKITVGMGGAMDLVSGARQVLITTLHTDKNGNSKILKKCRLPLTAVHAVDYIITELCVLHYNGEGLVLEELAPGVTVEEVIAKTEADLIIPEQIGSMV